MRGGFSEDSLVEQPADELFAELVWQAIGAFDEVFRLGGALRHANMGEVVPPRHLLPAL